MRMPPNLHAALSSAALLLARRPRRPAPAQAAPGWCPAPEVVHALDLENLVGGNAGPRSVARLWHHYQAVVPVGSADTVVAAVADRYFAAARAALPPRVRLYRGPDAPDGADTALLRALELHQPGTVLYLGTGDHAFTATALACAARGAQVVQVVGAGHTALALYRACARQVSLPWRYPAAARRNPVTRPVLPGAPIRRVRLTRQPQSARFATRHAGRAVVFCALWSGLPPAPGTHGAAPLGVRIGGMSNHPAPQPPAPQVARLRPVATPAPQPGHPGLSPGEIKVVRALVRFGNQADVCRALYLENSTVNTTLQRARAKYRAAGRPADNQIWLTLRALEDGLTTVEEACAAIPCAAIPCPSPRATRPRRGTARRRAA